MLILGRQPSYLRGKIKLKTRKNIKNYLCGSKVTVYKPMGDNLSVTNNKRCGSSNSFYSSSSPSILTLRSQAMPCKVSEPINN